MPSVPNWIAKGYAYQSYPRLALPVISWRATRTQAIVRVNGLTTELRFDLGSLDRVGGSTMRLLPPDDPRVIAAIRETTARNLIGDLRDALDEPLNVTSMEIEELVAAVDRIQRAATKALAGLADLL